MSDVPAEYRIRIIFSAEGAAEKIRIPSIPAWKAIWMGCTRRGKERIIQCERILSTGYAIVILEEENMKRLALIGLMLTSGVTVFPQELTLPQLQQKLIELEQRVRVLEKALLAQRRTPADANNTQVPAGRAAWRRLQRGMSPAQIRRLLGEPERIFVLGNQTHWYYSRGSVVFVNESLFAWNED